MNQYERMLAQKWYDANNDPDLLQQRMQALEAWQAYNQAPVSDSQKREALLKDLLQQDLPAGLTLLPPVYFDYGYLTHFGKDVFVNSSCYFMDGGTISIGDHCFIGPFCGFYTALHPLPYKERNAGFEKALPVVVENNCWLAAGVSVLPGVTIHEGCVIAAGSVVTKDMPASHLCMGSPCRPVRKIDQEERLSLCIDEE